MCFGSKPKKPEEDTEAEAKAAAEDRIEAEDEKREEVEKVAVQKREDISEALETSAEKKGMRGGAGRRSLFRSGGGGFLDRFS